MLFGHAQEPESLCGIVADVLQVDIPGHPALPNRRVSAIGAARSAFRRPSSTDAESAQLRTGGETKVRVSCVLPLHLADLVYMVLLYSFCERVTLFDFTHCIRPHLVSIANDDVFICARHCKDWK